MRLGQNFLADPNLLEAIVREAGLRPDDVVLEVGGGEGALTAGSRAQVGAVHVVELDERLREPLEALAAERANVALHFGDAMRLDLAALEPPPDRMVANLPYSIATPLMLRTIAELRGVESGRVMVQREIADRLRAAPRLARLRRRRACSSAGLRGRAAPHGRPGGVHAPPAGRLGADRPAAHRAGAAGGGRARWCATRSPTGASRSRARSSSRGPASRDAGARALVGLGLPADARAEQLAPEQFAALAAELEAAAG